MLNYWKRSNEWVAVKLSSIFSTMECFWVFCVIASLPVVFPSTLQIANYISSSYLQLIALPLLAVGAVVLGRASELRAQQDHEALMEELTLLKEMHSEVQELLELAHKKLDNMNDGD